MAAPSVEPLLQGFRRFQRQHFGNDHALYESLREGQHPGTLVIGCCDSRVHPPMLFDTVPGEIFTVRNVANLVPPNRPDNPHASVAAALEFAVLVLQVQHVIVLGHSGCGGIRALLQQNHAVDSALGQWLNLAAPARRFVCTHHSHAVTAQQQHLAEKAAILISLDNLRTYSWLAERERKGQTGVHGWYFDLHAGALWGYEPATRQFVPLVPPLPCNGATRLTHAAASAEIREEEVPMVTASHYTMADFPDHRGP